MITSAVSYTHLSAKVDEKDFKRRDTVSILYDILGAKLKNSDTTLAEKLKTLGVFTDRDEIEATKIIASIYFEN